MDDRIILLAYIYLVLMAVQIIINFIFWKKRDEVYAAILRAERFAKGYDETVLELNAYKIDNERLKKAIKFLESKNKEQGE